MTSKNEVQETDCNNFLMISKRASNSHDKVCRKISEINSSEKKVCYVCLSQPYTDIIDYLNEEQLSCDNVVFVDTLSSPLYSLKPIRNCIFVKGMENLETLQKAVKKTMKKHDCSTVVFDSISTLLVYQPSHAIVKFTYTLLSDEEFKATTKVFITLTESGVFKDENTKLIKDLSLFADKLIELS